VVRRDAPVVSELPSEPVRDGSYFGLGLAGCIATFRFGVARDADASSAKVALEPLVESAGITAVQLGRVDATAKFPVPDAVSPGSAAGAAQCVLLVEGLDRAELAAAAPRIIDALASALGAIQPVAWEGYDLAFVIERSGLKWPTTARQPARPEVRERSK
jgi:hypothetical protein